MQAREIRTWTTEDLQQRLEEAYRELFSLRRELAMGRLALRRKTPMRFWAQRKWTGKSRRWMTPGNA